MKVTTRAKAWEEVDSIFPTDYNFDVISSKNAGYNVYRSPLNHYDYICDLGDRLEVNFANGDTVNIWIADEPDFTSDEKCELVRYIDDFMYQLEDKLGYNMSDKKRACFKKYGLEKIGEILNDAYDKLNGERT